VSFVAILMGSESDRDVMKKAEEALGEFGVDSDTKVLSAHRKPEALVAYVRECEDNGVAAFICGAGLAAHIAGVVAAHTTRPVIGVPIASGSLNGFDSLLSMVQMPPNVPVATVAVNGARNAGLLAVQMLAVSDAGLAKKLVEFKRKLAEG
jgi:5-(carboxyamino)imidazole ribonucleotide mutase